MGDCAKAEPLYREALRIRQKVLDTEPRKIAVSLNDLAYCELDLGRFDEATTLARQSSTQWLAALSKMFSFASEEQRLAYLHIFLPWHFWSSGRAVLSK